MKQDDGFRSFRTVSDRPRAESGKGTMLLAALLMGIVGAAAGPLVLAVAGYELRGLWSAADAGSMSYDEVRRLVGGMCLLGGAVGFGGTLLAWPRKGS